MSDKDYFIDTHSHIYAQEFDNDLQEVILRAKNNAVKKIFLPNIDFSSVQRLYELVEKDSSMFYPMLGLYPGSVTAEVEDQLSQMYTLILKNNVCAIGEIGLDFYWDRSFYDQQIYALDTQLKWSNKLDKPLCIHCRKAFDEIFACLKKDNRKTFKGIFHCFSGDLNQARKLIEMGFLLGIGGVVTFKNAHLSDVVKNIPLQNIVLETDSPYLAPVPFRGKRNESSYIRIVADKLAAIKSVEIEEVARVTTLNTESLFNINHN